MAYTGDISVEEAWKILSSDQKAQLVDVRTLPEWQFAGVPDLSSLNKKPIAISWRNYPQFDPNNAFIETLKKVIPYVEMPLLFLCKTGGRSKEAAEAVTAAGYQMCYNVTNGFEGDSNDKGQRGSINGWKAAQLPWRQA